MNYIDEKQSYLKKNKLIVNIMILYVEDYEFLYQCLGFNSDNLLEDIEDIIICLIDLQGDDVHYSPLTIT